MHVAEAKEQLRQAMKERLERLSEKDRRTESQSVCTNLKRATETAATICAYYPLLTEPDILPFLEHCLQAGKRVYVPAFENALVFRRLRSLSELKPGALRIPEPPADAEQLVGSPDVVIVPGRAYDAQGGRLGRGAGGYDIWLKNLRAPRPRVLGVCFTCQMVHAVPVEEHDQRMDAVITARGLLQTSS